MSTADAVMQQHFAQPKVDMGLMDSNNAMDQLVGCPALCVSCERALTHAVQLNQFWDPMLLPDPMSTGMQSQGSQGYNMRRPCDRPETIVGGLTHCVVDELVDLGPR